MEERGRGKENVEIVLTVMELVIMAGLISFDVFIPSILVAITGFLFIRIRKEKMLITTLPQNYSKTKFVIFMFALAVFWSSVQFGLIMPIQNHLFHDTRNMEAFASIYNNLSNLLFFLLASWTLAAVVEEIAFRGFFQNRIISVFRNKKLGVITAVIATSLFFGFIHTEQGIIGIIGSAIDSIFFSFVRYQYKSIWASVLVHGFLNSIGFITFYFVGPVHGLW